MGDSGAMKSKTAVVLSGGGANGAYEVGVLKALCSGKSPATGYQPLEPDIFSGTSIGSFNAAFLVSQWDRYGTAAVANLEKFWLERLAGGWHDNGVFRLRGNPVNLFRPRFMLDKPLDRLGDFLRDGGTLTWEAVQRGVHFATSWEGSVEQRLVELVDLSAVISTEPMEQMLRGLDYSSIRRSGKMIKVAATNWATGELKIFSNHDLTDRFGPLAVRASASIPGFFPPVEYGAQPYCDGSVLLNTPLSSAIHAGADVIHVVYLDPDVKNIPLAYLSNTYDTLLRMMQITWASAYNDDIGDAARINRGLAAVQRIANREAVTGWERDFLHAAPELEKYVDRFRPLTIYRHHPQDPLEGQLGFLNFDQDRLESLIERGFQDTVYHDSEESGDIFPEDPAKPLGPQQDAF